MAKVEIKATRDIEDIVDSVMATVKELKTVVRKGGNIVLKAARNRAPRGDTRHKPSKPPLWTTIKTKVHEDGFEVMSFVSAKYPAGAHQHLVQLGHKVYRRGPKGQSARGKQLPPLSGKAYVQGKSFMQPAIDSTARQVEKFVDTEINKIWGRASK